MNLKFKVFVSAIFALMLIFATTAFAQENSVRLIPYDNFEGYSTTTTSPWTGQGAATKASVEQTDRGKSAALVSSKGAMQELFVDSTKTNDSMKTIITGFSLRLCDLNAKRSYFLRCKTQEFYVMEISTSGKVTVGSTTVTTLSIDKWYDFVVEYNMISGFVRVKVDDGTTEKVVEGECSVKGISGIYRVDFVSWGTSGDSDARCYLDNCWSYATSYESVPYAKVTKVVDFEDFVPTSDGQKAPSGWTLQNKATDATAASVSEFEGYGKSLLLSSNGTTFYQVIYSFGNINDSTIIIDFDFRMEPSSFVTFGLRGKNSSGASTRDNFPIAISTTGNLTLNGSKVGTLSFDTWYKVSLTLDITSQTYTVSFISEEENLGGSGSIPGDVRVLNGIDFFFPKGGGSFSTIYVDNIDVHAKRLANIVGFEPVLGKIPVGSTEIDLVIDGTFTDEAVDLAKVKINGDENKVTRKSKDGNRLIINFETDQYDNGYFIEITDLLCSDGTLLNVANGYYTGVKFAVSAPEFTKQSISGGETGVSVTVSSECDELTQATVVLALYNKTTEEMLAITYDSHSISKGDSETLQCSLNIPESDAEYELVAYIWDDFDGMKILGSSKKIN